MQMGLCTAQPLSLRTIHPREAGLAFIASALLTGITAARSWPRIPGNPMYTWPIDHHKYIFMATTNPLDFHVAPYCWRILVPFLARLMPLPLGAAFLAIAATAIALTRVAAYSTGHLVSGRRAAGWASLGLYFGLAWATKYNLDDFWLPDAFTLCLMAWAAVAAIVRQNAAFAILVALGAAAKESALFMVALHYGLAASRPLDRRAAIGSALAALPAVLVLISIRIAIPSWNGDHIYMDSLPLALRFVQPGLHDYGFAELFRLNAERRIVVLFQGWTYRAYTVGTFGLPVCVLFLLGAVQTREYLLRVLPFLVLIYAQILLAYNAERLIVAGFPAVLLLSNMGLDGVSRHRQLPGWCIAVAPLVFVVANMLNPKTIEAPLITQIWLAALVTLLLYFISMARRHKRTEMRTENPSQERSIKNRRT